MTGPYYQPLDLRCPDCNAPPGAACTWVKLNGKPTFRPPHASRVTAARDASTRRSRAGQRQPPSPPPPPPGGPRS